MLSALLALIFVVSANAQCASVNTNISWPPPSSYQVFTTIPQVCNVAARVVVNSGNFEAVDSVGNIYYSDSVRGTLAISPSGTPSVFSQDTCDGVGPLGCYILVNEYNQGGPVFVTGYSWGSGNLFLNATLDPDLYSACTIPNECYTINFINSEVFAINNVGQVGANFVLLLSASTGATILKLPMPSLPCAGVLMDGVSNRVYVTLPTNLSAYDLSGNLLWSQQGMYDCTQTMTTPSSIVSATNDGFFVVSINSATGATTFNSSFLTEPCNPVAILTNCTIICLNPFQGNFFSLVPSSPPVLTDLPQLLTFNPIIGFNLVVDGAGTGVFAVNQTVVAVDLNTMATLWEASIGSGTVYSLAIGLNTVAVTVLGNTGSGSLYILAAKGVLPCPS